LLSPEQFHEKFSNDKSFKIPTLEDFPWLNPDKVYSSVLVIIHFPENIPSIILTKRSPNLKNHAGEISFPGGKFSSLDKSILDTALRETYEEISVAIKKKQIIGCLNPTYTYTSKILIYPFVALEEENISNKLKSNSEVEQIISLPIEKLMDSLAEDGYHSSKNFKMYKFLVDDYLIWGATARILKDLFDKIININNC
jgi:8-oxo-dGTP pyrophosphatase MutT (NUDIX family)